MSLHFIKELPQKRHGNQVKLDEITTALKARPGEWAAIRAYPKPRRKAAYTYISNVRRGKVKALDPKQGFEFQVISEPTKTVVYARYIKAT